MSTIEYDKIIQPYLEQLARLTTALSEWKYFSYETRLTIMRDAAKQMGGHPIHVPTPDESLMIVITLALVKGGDRDGRIDMLISDLPTDKSRYIDYRDDPVQCTEWARKYYVYNELPI